MSETLTPQEKTAKDAVDRFTLRFGDPHRRLAQVASLPLALTPDLLHFLRNRFLRGVTPWIAEADLLLSALCEPAGYELYVMQPAVRKILIAELGVIEDERKSWKQEVARLMISYVQSVLKEDPRWRRREMEAQRWAAMAYLDDGRDAAVQEIAWCMQDVLSGAQTAEGDDYLVEMARLVGIVSEVAPQIQEYTKLLEYAEEFAGLLRDEASAITQRLREHNEDLQFTFSDGVTIGLPDIFLRPAPDGGQIDQADTPVTDLPLELQSQGSQAVEEYLQASRDQGEHRWFSKLLVVGQGGAGKTSLLQSLRGESHVDRSTTYGVEVDRLELPHPTEPGIMMRLGTWDFGGQEIYHATHQFFLTNCSLFLIVWNARWEWEQAKLYYWLDTIRALAPDSPVLLVATWIDEREARLPYREIAAKYPNVVGNWPVSNKTNEGIDDLRAAIASTALRLPLMGETWPATWLDAAEAVRSLPAGYMHPEELRSLMRHHGVKEDACSVLARWLHELGDILYFEHDQELNHIVVLKPEWVSNEISKVLESSEVERRKGVLSDDHLDELWSDIDREVRGHLLKLMEEFGLSYRIMADPAHSIVVERLPLDPPDYLQLWDAPKGNPGCKEIAIRYDLNTIPAGIPTWFVAREHRWTTLTHWRAGAVFAQELMPWARIALGDTDAPRYTDALAAARTCHLALIQADAQKMCVKLTVRGPIPANFFLLLKDRMENILARFPGLEIKRIIPCPGHGGQPCAGEWNLLKLELAIRQNISMVQCPESFYEVPVAALLYGVHGQTTLDVLLQQTNQLDGINQQATTKLEDISRKLNDLELKQREFTSLFRSTQEQIDLRCPNVFVVYRVKKKGFWSALQRTITGDELVLHLCCQQPGQWHPVNGGGRYVIPDPANWLKTMAPYMSYLAHVMQYAMPFIGPAVGVMSSETADLFREQIVLMERLTGTYKPEVSRNPVMFRGAQLRHLRKLLETVDPNREWGGLDPVVTKEGHNLWLCEHHRAEYPERFA